MKKKCDSRSGNFRDRIEWQQDDADDGAAEPAYTKTLISNLPCRVTNITGDETYHGRQLEGHIDYVVTFFRVSKVTSNLRPWDRGKVTAGTHAGKFVNVVWIKEIGYSEGRPPETEVYCRQLVATPAARTA